MGLLSSWAFMDWMVLFFTILALIYVYSTWTFNHWQKIGVPYLANPKPYFGNMKGVVLGKQSFRKFYADMYKQFKGNSFGGFFKFREPAVVVCDPELVKTVMSTDFPSFHDNDFDVSVDVDPMAGRNPFTLKGERWKVIRQQLTPAFTPSKIKPLFPLMNEVCKDMVEYLEKNCSSPAGIEAKEMATKFTTDIVATCAYGLNANSFTDPKAEFIKMGRNLMTSGSWWRNFQVSMMMVSPKLANFFRFRLFDETVTNFFRGVVKNTMDHREKNKVTRNDFLQLLMQLKAKGRVDDSNTDGVAHAKFTDDDVAAQALTFFSDGFETSSIVLTLALYEIAISPEIQNRLREEVDTAMKKHGGKLNYEMLQELPYLDMILLETIRKYPVVPAFTRLCTKPYDLPSPAGGVYRVTVGTPVVVPILGLHMDPEYFPDPDRFDPERFTEENKASRRSYVFLPFGGGPRLCIGRRFGTTQVSAGIVAVMANFELERCKQTPIPLEFDDQAFLPFVKEGVWLKFTKRVGKKW